MDDLQIRGYGEMAIGDATRPFHIGIYQARTFCELRGCELEEYHSLVATLGSGGLKDSLLLCDVLYSALVAGAKLKKQATDFTADDVVMWVDTAAEGEVRKLFAVAKTLADTGPEPEKAPGKAPGPRLQK